MRYRRFVVTLVLLITLVVTACGQSPDPTAQGDEGKTTSAPFLKFRDDTGKTVTLKEQPKRIVVLSPEFLTLLYDLEGEAVGRISTYSSPVPKAAQDLPEVGTINQINVEKLVALNPDFVIGTPSFHGKLSDLMKRNEIPFALMQMRSFNDVKEKAALLGQITGNEGKAKQRLKETEGKMEDISAKLPKSGPSFVVLNVTPSNVSIQRANTTALEIGELLRMDNLAKPMNPKPDGSQTSVPYSMEALVEAQPDYVFITIHGAQEQGEKKIKKELEGNPAWASLKAVQQGRVRVIPSARYLTNPGLAYDQSMLHMAKIVYPDIFDDGKK